MTGFMLFKMQFKYISTGFNVELYIVKRNRLLLFQ